MLLLLASDVFVFFPSNVTPSLLEVFHCILLLYFILKRAVVIKNVKSEKVQKKSHPFVCCECCEVEVSATADHSFRGVLPTVARRCV